MDEPAKLWRKGESSLGGPIWYRSSAHSDHHPAWAEGRRCGFFDSSILPQCLIGFFEGRSCRNRGKRDRTLSRKWHGLIDKNEVSSSLWFRALPKFIPPSGAKRQAKRIARERFSFEPNTHFVIRNDVWLPQGQALWTDCFVNRTGRGFHPGLMEDRYSPKDSSCNTTAHLSSFFPTHPG